MIFSSVVSRIGYVLCVSLLVWVVGTSQYGGVCAAEVGRKLMAVSNVSKRAIFEFKLAPNWRM